MTPLQVKAYLQRIGLDQDYVLKPTLDCLNELHSRHLFSVPFENIDIHAGKEIEIGFDAVFDKVIRQRRGGYCFEVNALFAHLLEVAGFQVKHRGARVWYGYEAGGAVRPRTHQIIEVQLDDDRWLVDTAFGNGILLPLKFQPDIEQIQFGRPFRMTPDEQFGYMVEQRLEQRWVPLYSFADETCYPGDYQVANFFSSRHPESIFTRVLFCSMPGPTGRKTLCNREFTIREGRAETKIEVNSLAHLLSLLDEHFHIKLDPKVRIAQFEQIPSDQKRTTT